MKTFYTHGSKFLMLLLMLAIKLFIMYNFMFLRLLETVQLKRVESEDLYQVEVALAGCVSKC